MIDLFIKCWELRFAIIRCINTSISKHDMAWAECGDVVLFFVKRRSQIYGIQICAFDCHWLIISVVLVDYLHALVCYCVRETVCFLYFCAHYALDHKLIGARMKLALKTEIANLTTRLN